MGQYYIILPQIHIAAIERKYKKMRRLGEVRYSSDTTERMNKDDIKKILQKTGWISNKKGESK